MSMTQAEREFLALDGFIQWTSAAITQAEPLAGATISVRTPDTALLTLAALRTETDFFCCGSLEGTGISQMGFSARSVPVH